MPYRAANQARQLAMMLQKSLSTQERSETQLYIVYYVVVCLLKKL